MEQIGNAAKLVNVVVTTPFGDFPGLTRPTRCSQYAARAGCVASGGANVTGKADKPEKPEPTPGTQGQSFGDALAEMGFLPLDNPPRRLIVRLGVAGRPLKLRRLPKEQT
jgi:hypothetical protein